MVRDGLSDKETRLCLEVITKNSVLVRFNVSLLTDNQVLIDFRSLLRKSLISLTSLPA